MNRGLSHLDITQIFVDVDDFCQLFEPLLTGLLLPEVSGHSLPKSRLSLSKIMTILIGFHGSGYRTFKDFYTLQVLSSRKSAMPNLVSTSVCEHTTRQFERGGGPTGMASPHPQVGSRGSLLPGMN